MDDDQPRHARVGERLVTTQFHPWEFWDGGFTTADEPHVMVQVLDGSLLQFEENIRYLGPDGLVQTCEQVARVGLMPVEYPEVFAVLDLDSGDRVTFRRLNPGQRVTVLRTPADMRASINLLAENLSVAQREQYATHRLFEVVGGDSGKRYRIRHGCQQNIDELDAGSKCSCTWCFFPSGGLMEGDVMLAQKTALELFESDALRVARRIPLPSPDMRACVDYHHDVP